MDTFVVLGFALVLLALAGVAAAVVWAWVQTSRHLTDLNEKVMEGREMQRGATESFGSIQKNLGQLTEASRHMERVGEEIASLADLLRAPKVRGGIGEFLLGDLLSQMLSPEQYALGYSFRSGERVDAVIRLRAGLVPVDSKFPLESFQRLLSVPAEERVRLKRDFSRAVRKHVDDIASKYILPDEGTFDFALMYIPAESVYYETIVQEEGFGRETGILTYALGRHVIPVSPNSFFAYLQAIALGLKGLQIEKGAQEIMRVLGRLRGDLDRFKEEYDTLGGHLERARRKYEDASRAFSRFEEKLIQATEPSQEPGEPGLALPSAPEGDG
ncbi:MAG: DNA recombination protein RmuC [Anaerolineales bacterium]|jgi:DNA recombination protein RmuC